MIQNEYGVETLWGATPDGAKACFELDALREAWPGAPRK